MRATEEIEEVSLLCCEDGIRLRLSALNLGGLDNLSRLAGSEVLHHLERKSAEFGVGHAAALCSS
jgi:hypothetical protein